MEETILGDDGNCRFRFRVIDKLKKKVKRKEKTKLKKGEKK